ncbi:MAG: PAS domain S-box protein [Desulfobulbaceae bacterium]|nr:PAS domain S-box protein [Desulfobulbaceae bacterium]
MKDEILELFRLASKFFFKKYKETGGSQSQLAEEFGVTQSYLSSVMNGSRSASFELYNRISERLYGPLDKFIAAGRRIQDGLDPLADEGAESEDSVEKLIAQLTYYVMDYKRLQQDMSKQKVFYETIIENLQSGVIVTDKKNKIIYVNRFMEKMFGMKANKIVGTTPFDSDTNILELDTGSLNREYRKAVEKLTPVYYEQIPITTNSDQLFYISGWIIPLLKGDAFDGMICTLRDTTITQNLSDLLNQSLEQNQEGILVVQQDSPANVPKAYFANTAFSEIFDLAGLDLKPNRVAFLEFIEIMKRKMKNASQWENLENEAFAGQRDHVQCIIQMNKGGEYQWSSKPLMTDNRLIGRFATIKKIKTKTAQKNK